MPAAAITLLSSGVPLNHQSFWAKKSPADIQSLHHRLTATPLKVISILFNNLVGLGRRPIAHTGDSSLELSTSYANYEVILKSYNKK